MRVVAFQIPTQPAASLCVRRWRKGAVFLALVAMPFVATSCTTPKNGGQATTRVKGESPSTRSDAASTSTEDSGVTGSCYMEIVAKDGTRSEYEIQAGGQLTIGRSSFTDITIARRYVSKRHARVSNEGERCFIEDTKSTNGVYVNNIEVPIDARTEVGAGDKIFVGTVTIYIVPR